MHHINKHFISKKLCSCILLSATALSCLCIHNIQSTAAEITLDSDMSYVDMSKYTQVLLPTSSTIAFALDPQGLSSMSSDSVNADSVAASAGRIVSRGEVNIVNYSYYPLKAKVSLYITDTGQSSFVNSSSDIDSDTEQKICLTVTPSSTKTTVLTDSRNIITGTVGYTASDSQIPVIGSTPSDANSILFVLPGADYDLSKEENKSGDILYNAERDLAGDYGTATFKIGGQINKNADWSQYIGKNAQQIKLNAVFSYETINSDEYSELTDIENNKILPGTYNMINQ